VVLPLPADAREQLTERKRAALRALRELDFEHDAGHVSDAPAPAAAPAPARPAPAPRSAWRHPASIAVGAIALVAFGVTLGVGVVRYTEPDPMAGQPLPGSRPLASLGPPPGGGGPVSPEMLQGMLQAARSSLFAGRYQEAIAAYQAVLKRQPANVDAMTHLALIVAIGGHADSALETLDKALAIDPDYPPALLYRGQILHEARQDTAGAIRSWERFLEIVPTGEDHARVAKLLADLKKAPPKKSP
jgi:tetratricopeptide (TPR) repeat protein